MFRKLLLSVALLVVIGLQANAAYVPVTLTGFNTDGVCNSVGAPNTSTTNLGSTAASPSGFDAQGYWLTDSTFNPGSGTTTVPAMPTNLLLTSQLDPTVKWQLKPYTGNNVLRIVDVNNDSLVFQTAQSAGELCILYTNVTTVTSGGSVDITVNFTDGSTQVFPANATPNWFNNIAVSGITSAVYMIGGRYNGNAGGGFQNTGGGSPAGPQLYQFKLAIAAANYSKTIRSVKFSNLTAGNMLNVFGITLGTVCTGAVTAGTVTSSAGNSVCPSVAFNLSLAGGTSGVGITYQWQSSTTGGAPWTNLGTAASQPANQTVATTYRAYIRCNSGTADTSAPVTITMKTANQCYCIPVATSSTYYLANFTTTGATLNVNNTSGAGITSIGYSDYSGTQTVSAAPAATVNFSATGNTSGATNYTFVWRIYVDWNQNGLFDPAEQMFTNGTTYANSVTGSFVVPATATGGLTRMRVFADYYSSTGAPCTFSTTGPLGEAEDYAFNVISLCSPVTGLAAGSITGVSASLSWTAVTGAAGYEYVLDQVATNPARAGTATTAVSYNASALTPLTTYYMHVRTNCGAAFSSWATISFTTLCVNPIATITVNGPTTVCMPNTVLLHANRATPLTYQWKIGGIDITGATDSTYNVTASGSYTVVTKVGTCTTVSTPTVVTINPKPDTTVTMTPVSGVICSGNTATLNAAVITGATYQWYLNGAAIAGATAATYPATTAGNYRVLVTNATTCSDTSGIHTVTVNTTPSVVVTPTTAPVICAGDNVVLTATGAATYSWSPAAGLSATTGATVTATPTATTTYTVVGDNGTGCTASATKTITVNALPTVSVSPTGFASICNGGNFVLTANGASTYSWAPAGTLSASTGATVTASPIATTVYTVTGTDINGCIATATKSVTVNTPNITITPTTALAFCGSGSATLTANGGVTYTWSPAINLNTTTGATVIATPTITRTYTVTAVDGNGCTGIATKTITINAIPTVGITSALSTICEGTTVALTGTGASTYSWTPTATLSAGTGTTVTASPITSTTYTVVGTSTAGCTASATKLITLNPAPTIGVSPATSATFCVGGSVAMTATGGVSYTWSPTTNLSATTGATVTASPTATITYTVTGTGTNGCTNTANQIVTVNQLPIIAVTPAVATVCIGGGVALTASGAVTYTWSPAATLSATTGPTVTASPTINTTYTINAIDANGCAGSTTKLVSVIAVPTITVTPVTSTTCAGVGVVLTANGGTTYSWSPANNVSATTGTSITVSPTSTTTYTVTGNSGNGCTNTATALINVNPLPNVQIAPAGLNLSCVETPVTLVASGAVSYSWSPATALSTTTGTTVIATPNTTMIYTVVGTDNKGCQKATNSAVNRYPKPEAAITPAGTIELCNADTTRLWAVYPAYPTYKWQMNGSDIAGATANNILPTNDGSYTISVIDDHGCHNATDVPANITHAAVPTPVIAVNGRILSTTTTFALYQWYYNGILIAGATSQSYEALRDGLYTVTVSNTAGVSCTATAAAYHMTQLVINNAGLNKLVKLYPNPAVSVIHIDAPVAVTVQITGMDGRLMLKKEDAHDLDISAWADGVYNVMMTEKNGTYIRTEKFVKLSK